MGNFLLGVAVAVVASLIVALIILLVKIAHTRHPHPVTEARTIWKRRRDDKARREQEDQRSAYIAAMTADGSVIPVSKSGWAPSVVTMSNGTDLCYFGNNLKLSKLAVESGQYPPDRSFPKLPPKLAPELGVE